MDRYLANGTEIKLKGIDGHYVIKDIIGRGSSCVVYSADFYNLNNEKTEHLLKEFNPRCIDLKRDDNGLTPRKDDEKELFQSLCDRFKDGFERQAILRTIPELKNYTANIQNTYYDYGTVYIDMTETNGESYAEVEEKSIHNLAQRIKVLAQVIGNYHKHGYLHLDIKPSNIFARPEDETCQDVLLFDFDSLVPFSEENGKCVIDKSSSVSYTTEYAPIELLTASRRGRICKATDIYEIGEIFFEKLMGRHSTALEHNVWADFDYDISKPMFENINPRVLPLLDELFTHTLCNDVNMRYQSTDELIGCFDKIIEIVSSTDPYLISNIKSDLRYEKSPGKSLINIHEKLQNTGMCFNKSTLKKNISKYVKEYIKYFSGCYETVLSLDCNNGFIDMFLNIPIMNFEVCESKSTYEQALQVFNVLERICNNRVLIIIDNFDERYLVDSKFASYDYCCDMQEVYDICCRLLFLNATILVNGSFNIDNFYKKEHYRHFHELLYLLSEKCYHKRKYDLAKDYIKKAISIIKYCSAKYVDEYIKKDSELLNMVQIDFELSVGYGADLDEIEIDSFLEQFDDCVDDI